MSQEKFTSVSETANRKENSEDCGHEVNACTCPPDKELSLIHISEPTRPY